MKYIEMIATLNQIFTREEVVDNIVGTAKSYHANLCDTNVPCGCSEQVKIQALMEALYDEGRDFGHLAATQW